LRPAGLGRTTRCEALDENLGTEEQGRPGEKAKCDPSVTGRGLEGLLNELVRDSADQDSCAEGHGPKVPPLGAEGGRRRGGVVSWSVSVAPDAGQSGAA
jgi:hypothetical protein